MLSGCENLLFLSPRDRPEEVHLCARRAVSCVCMFACVWEVPARSLSINTQTGRPSARRSMTHDISVLFWTGTPLPAGPFFTFYLSHTDERGYIKCITLQQPSLPNPLTDPAENKGLEKQQHRRLPPVKDKHGALGLNMFPPYTVICIG